MRLLIVNSLYHPYKIGGAEKSVKSLAEEFKKTSIKEVGILTLGETGGKEIINDISVWRLKIKNIYWPYSIEQKTKKNRLNWHLRDVYNKGYDDEITSILNEFAPDIVFTNNLSGFSVRVWDICKLKKVKIVHTLRDYYLQCPRTSKFRNNKNCNKRCLDCKLLSLVKKKASKKVDTVIGISNYVLEDHLNQGFFKGVKNQVIYNGFNLEELNKASSILKKNEVTFGYIGQIKKEKGVELMLNSFSEIDKKLNWRLLIAGEVSLNYKKELKEIFDSEKITFLGYTKNSNFFDRIDALIVPSVWNEPFGRVILEGRINKKIVLSSDKGGLKEIINADNSFIFKTDSKELLLLLTKVINNFHEIKFNNEDEDLDKFNIKNTVKLYNKVFLNLIK